MHTKLHSLTLLAGLALCGCSDHPDNRCTRTGALIPPRTDGAITGSGFINTVSDLPRDEREARTLDAITRGNIPDFLRVFVPIHVSATIDGRVHDATYYVMPDYLSIGSDHDFVRMPMTPATAQAIADRFSCVLPTPKMVDDVYRNAAVKLAPSPISPKTTDITATETFLRHHGMIEAQRAAQPLGLLVAGIKKDVVITPRLADRPGKVAIYGWHRLDCSPIQPLYLGHVDWYVDYSHGVRLVNRQMALDGNPADLQDILQHPLLHVLVADEQHVPAVRY